MNIYYENEPSKSMVMQEISKRKLDRELRSLTLEMALEVSKKANGHLLFRLKLPLVMGKSDITVKAG